MKRLLFTVRKGANLSVLQTDCDALPDNDIDEEEEVNLSGISKYVMLLNPGQSDLCFMLKKLHDCDAAAWHILADFFQTPWGQIDSNGFCSVYRDKSNGIACAIEPHRPPVNMVETLWKGSLTVADEPRRVLEALFTFGPLREYLLSLACMIITESWAFRQKHLCWQT
mgnify:CR=1 FL=1